jgi:hypothetical protein
VNALEHIVLGAVDTCTALLCRRAPGQKDNTASALLADKIDDLLCKLLPAFTGMRVGLVGAHSEAGIQQQYAAISPRCEQTSLVRWRFERRIFLFQCFVDILEGWGRRSRGPDGKTKAVSLVVIMVWVLAEDNGLDGIEWRVSRPGRDVNSIGTRLEDGIRHTNCRHPLMEERSSCQPQLQSSGTSSGQGKTWS